MTTRYRCLIVDDEDLIIDRLRLLFRDFADRFELAGAAYSGMEALELAGQLQPDIVLTDIVMPHMDGLALIAALKPLLPSAVFVILTAYSDFEYAKQAIKLGVNDYLIKVPLNGEELRSALEKAALVMEERKRVGQELQQLNRSRLQNVYRLRSQMFGELLRGAATARQISLMREDLRLEANLKHYFAFMLEDSDYSAFAALYNESDRSVLKYALLNIVEETIGEQTLDGIACETGENRYLGLVCLDSGLSESRHHNAAMALGHALIANVGTYLRRRINVGFSRIYSGWDSLRQACGEAAVKLEGAYYEAAEAILYPSYPFRPDPAAVEWAARKRGELVQMKEISGMETAILGILERLEQEAPRLAASPEAVTSQLEQLLEAVYGLVRDRLELAQDKDKPPELRGMGFHAQLAVCRKYAQACLELLQRAGRPEIRKAKQYIEASLTKRCTLDEIAEHAGLAPTYLSTLFKREEGETLVDYMNRRKIEKAMELLKEGDYSNLELSEMVGIMNERYFCTLFKQICGLPPKKYRKKYL